jgi:hypothetical protein
MFYAVDVHATEDWGDGPVWECGYDLVTEEAAREVAVVKMLEQVVEGVPVEWIGAYVISDDAGDGEPSIEDTLTLHHYRTTI